MVNMALVAGAHSRSWVGPPHQYRPWNMAVLAGADPGVGVVDWVRVHHISTLYIRAWTNSTASSWRLSEFCSW